MKKAEMLRLLDRPEVDSWRALMNGFQVLYRHFEEALVKEGCSYSRFQLLFFLYFEGPLAPVDISKKMLVTRSNVSMFLRRMIQDNLVKESSTMTSSKRPSYVLTSQGKDFFEKILPHHVGRVVSKMPALPKSQLKILENLTRRS
ncbi:MAG: MarR family transcriptional regulator [Bdellovibrionota bacterium]